MIRSRRRNRLLLRNNKRAVEAAEVCEGFLGEVAAVAFGGDALAPGARGIPAAGGAVQLFRVIRWYGGHGGWRSLIRCGDYRRNIGD